MLFIQHRCASHKHSSASYYFYFSRHNIWRRLKIILRAFLLPAKLYYGSNGTHNWHAHCVIRLLIYVELCKFTYSVYFSIAAMCRRQDPVFVHITLINFVLRLEFIEYLDCLCFRLLSLFAMCVCVTRMFHCVWEFLLLLLLMLFYSLDNLVCSRHMRYQIHFVHNSNRSNNSAYARKFEHSFYLFFVLFFAIALLDDFLACFNQ